MNNRHENAKNFIKNSKEENTTNCYYTTRQTSSTDSAPAPDSKFSNYDALFGTQLHRQKAVPMTNSGFRFSGNQFVGTSQKCSLERTETSAEARFPLFGYPRDFSLNDNDTLMHAVRYNPEPLSVRNRTGADDLARFQ
ncbi:hypothetical protein WA026_017244 [Henosepilachna vigintioctopunctata]|uniref:Uncharacterized protein n=1 Tax=Henosepilachna vigintioctopunctata TaxID=420089 RepID=A0AAW1UGS6_9CUCU